jgi:hypothetical protein
VKPITANAGTRCRDGNGTRKELIVLAVSIQIPADTQQANVKTLGLAQMICAEGTASNGGQSPAAVWAKIYSQSPSPAPASPPGDASQGSVLSNTWQFLMIPGAAAAGSSPYPTNYLVVWAGYPSVSGTTYENATVSFLGVSATKTDCDP